VHLYRRCTALQWGKYLISRNNPQHWEKAQYQKGGRTTREEDASTYIVSRQRWVCSLREELLPALEEGR